MSPQQSRSQTYTRFWAVNVLARMSSTSRCLHSWGCFTLLAAPDHAINGLYRARAVSLRRVMFSFLCQILSKVYSYVQIHIYLTYRHVQTWVGAQRALTSLSMVRIQDHSVSFMLCDISFFTSAKTYYLLILRVYIRLLEFRLSNREVCFKWIPSAAAAVCCCCSVWMLLCCFVSPFVTWTPCAVSRRITLTWYIRCILYAAARRTSMYLYVLAMYFCRNCCFCRCCCLRLPFVIVFWMSRFVPVVNGFWF